MKNLLLNSQGKITRKQYFIANIYILILAFVLGLVSGILSVILNISEQNITLVALIVSLVLLSYPIYSITIKRFRDFSTDTRILYGFFGVMILSLILEILRLFIVNDVLLVSYYGIYILWTILYLVFQFKKSK